MIKVNHKKSAPVFSAHIDVIQFVSFQMMTSVFDPFFYTTVSYLINHFLYYTTKLFPMVYPYGIIFDLTLEKEPIYVLHRHLDFPLKLLEMQPNCAVYPDLHKLIQVRSGLAQAALNRIMSGDACHLTGEIHGCLLTILQTCAIYSSLLLLLPFIQERRESTAVILHSLEWHARYSQTKSINSRLSCQEDSEDDETGRRPTEGLLLEAEQSTEDGELQIPHEIN